MSVLAIAWIGVGIVLVTILALRLHPLLGLLLGTLFLLAATPNAVWMERELLPSQRTVVERSGELLGFAQYLPPGSYVVRRQGTALADARPLELRRATAEQLLAQQLLEEPKGANSELVWYSVGSDSLESWFSSAEEAFEPQGKIARFELLSTAAIETAERSRYTQLGSQLADGFSKTFQRLGIPVTMAAIVGICLLESGAAVRLVSAIVALLGARGTAPALTVSGFLLGVPVYFDNVFYLLLPLAKAVGRQRPTFYLTAVMAIIVGATMAHSLVPPTPGPLLVATELGVSIGAMMLGGCFVGSIAAAAGFAYGSLCSRWISLSPDQASDKNMGKNSVKNSDKNNEPPSVHRRQVSLWIAPLPIALPMLVLSSSEIVKYLTSATTSSATSSAASSAASSAEGLSGSLVSALAIVGPALSVMSDPNLLFIATAVLSIMVLRYYTDRQTVSKSVARGLTDAGTIVLLTCAGGAFGAALQQLGLADALRDRYAGFTTPWGMLMTGFFLTAIIRAAQGSATVAMITSVAIIAPVISSIDLPFHPVYVALAIGCGSKPLPWMNDSGFWQVATMTGMSTTQTLQTFTVALTLMGCVGFAVTLLGAWLLPLV